MIPILSLVGLVAFAPPQNNGAALLREVESVARASKGFTCDLTAVRIYPSAKAGVPPYRGEDRLHVVFKRPNLFKIDAKEQQQSFESISDGTNLYNVGNQAYSTQPIDALAEDFHWYHDDLLQLYVKGSFAKAIEAPRPPVVTELPAEDWQGKQYKVLEVKVGGGYPIVYKLYVGNDKLVHRVVHSEENFGRADIIESTAENFALNPPSKRAEFSFSPPSGYKKRSSEMPLRPGEFRPIQPGADATDFSLPTPQGGKLSLKEAMQGSRAVLLNFWFVHCPPCRAEHPSLQKFYDEMKPKGLALITVDDQDPADLSSQYTTGGGYTFPVVLTGPMFPTDPKTGQVNYMGSVVPQYASLAPYGVHECPTNILIDSSTGKVVWRSTSWDEAGLRKALKGLGVE